MFLRYGNTAYIATRTLNLPVRSYPQAVQLVKADFPGPQPFPAEAGCHTAAVTPSKPEKLLDVITCRISRLFETYLATLNILSELTEGLKI